MTKEKLNLDEAAFYCSIGLEPKILYADNPLDTRYEFDIPKWAQLYRKYIKLVNYSSYTHWRKNLKFASRHRHGLRMHYGGRTKITFKDSITPEQLASIQG